MIMFRICNVILAVSVGRNIVENSRINKRVHGEKWIEIVGFCELLA